jgi:hypothetical protein
MGFVPRIWGIPEMTMLQGNIIEHLMNILDQPIPAPPAFSGRYQATSIWIKTYQALMDPAVSSREVLGSSWIHRENPTELARFYGSKLCHNTPWPEKIHGFPMRLYGSTAVLGKWPGASVNLI